ncbi:MAG: zinc-dependent metalloprotease family protein [Chitinophagaceae bacterium]
MRTIYHFFFTVIAVLCVSLSLSAQNGFFKDNGANTDKPTTGQKILHPGKFRASGLEAQSLKDFLWSLPAENAVVNKNLTPVMELPMPDGKMARFRVWESSVMEPGLAAKFAEMKTFTGQGIDDPSATVRFDYNPYFGFHAQILSPNGRVFIDPYARFDISNYISYYSSDYIRTGRFICETPGAPARPNNPDRITAGPCRGSQLYTYRLALACTGEYAVAVAGPGPTVPAVAAAMLTSVNRVVGVYETELAIRMVLVANNNNLIYLDGTSDPYTNNNGGTMLGQNQANIDAVIGSANYDIGHVFSTGGGGVAFLGCVCNAASKARGVTGRGNPIGDDFDIDYVAHEMGHQFGGNHTFNSSLSNCGGGNRNGSTAYEVGSGTTIQAYAGICSSDDTQPHSDPFFHTVSFDEISNYIESGGTCKVATATGNSPPVITAMNNNGASIPLNTPFTLTGTATDPNGDPVTYCWEEWDLGPSTTWNGGNANTTSPLFKSRVPKTSGSRTFPDLAVILAGYPANPPATMGGLKGETLPTLGRTMKFRLTVRDNRAGGGGVVTGGEGCQAGFSSPFVINVIDGTGPFVVTVPNGGENYLAGTPQTITWNVAGTSAAPISVANVKVTLSTDGGLTYPTVLLANTPNDGSESIFFPCVNSSTARVRIEAVGNIFFDISNNDFSIYQGFDFTTPPDAVTSCPVPSSMSVTLGTITGCGFSNAISLSAGPLPPGTSINFAPASVTPGNSSVITLNGTNTLPSGIYTITITGNAAGAPLKTRILTFIIPTLTAPVITTQPANQLVCSGSNSSICVIASGTNTYQWQSSPTCSGPFADIPGATASCLPITIATTTTSYRVRVSGLCGGNIISDCVTLTVISPVTITAQPVNKLICSETNTSFTVAASSSQPISYQWQVNTGSGFANVPNAAPYSGGTTATLSITNAPVSMNGYLFRVLLTNTTCTTPVISAVATLTVRQTPSIGLSASPLTSLLPGQTTTLTATPSSSTGGAQTVNWFLNGTPFINPSNTYLVTVETVGTYYTQILEIFSGGLVCTNQSADVTITATASNKLFIFPSPNDGNFTVSYYNNGGTSTRRNISIFDSKGSMVYNRFFPITGSYTLIPINLQSASRGIYYVVVGDATGKKLADGKVHVR